MLFSGRRFVGYPNMEKAANDNNIVEEDDQAKESEKDKGASLIVRLSTAFFYAFASAPIMIINKQALTVYEFPSFQVIT